MKILRILPLLLLLGGFTLFDRPVSIYLAGDSTMAQKLASRRPETGWGEHLQQYFDMDRARVVNLARTRAPCGAVLLRPTVPGGLFMIPRKATP